MVAMAVAIGGGGGDGGDGGDGDFAVMVVASDFAAVA